MTQRVCHVCGSIYVGKGLACRVCKSKGLDKQPMSLEAVSDIDIPEGLRVGLYITTMNQWEVTRDCLLSLKRYTLYPFDAYIMDGASTDGTPERVKKEFPWVKVLELDKPYWVSYAWNRILEHALANDYDYIGILNNDLFFKPGWLKQTLSCFIQDPDVGYASPVHETHYGKIREIGKNRYGHFDTVLYATKETNELVEPIPLVWMPGACIVLRRQAVLEVGMFDEGFYFSDDEVDYCVRLWHNGWKVVSNPLARIVHLVSVTISEHGGHKGERAKELKDNYNVDYVRPKDYFYQKWSVSDLDSIMETVKPEQDKIGLRERAVRIYG